MISFEGMKRSSCCKSLIMTIIAVISARNRNHVIISRNHLVIIQPAQRYIEDPYSERVSIDFQGVCSVTTFSHADLFYYIMRLFLPLLHRSIDPCIDTGIYISFLYSLCIRLYSYFLVLIKHVVTKILQDEKKKMEGRQYIFAKQVMLRASSKKK